MRSFGISRATTYQALQQKDTAEIIASD